VRSRRQLLLLNVTSLYMGRLIVASVVVLIPTTSSDNVPSTTARGEASQTSSIAGITSPPETFSGLTQAQTNSPSSPQQKSTSSGGLSGGAIGGIVAAALVGGILIGVIAVYFCVRHRKQGYNTPRYDGTFEDKPIEVVGANLGNPNVGGGEQLGDHGVPSGRLRYPD
jgi:hypothetical protein